MHKILQLLNKLYLHLLDDEGSFLEGLALAIIIIENDLLFP